MTFGLPPTANALLAYLDMLDGTELTVVGVGLGRRPHGHAGGAPAHSNAAVTSTSGSRSTTTPTHSPTNVELVEQAVALAGEVGRPHRHHRPGGQDAGAPQSGSERRKSSNAALTSAGRSCWIQCPEPATHTGSRSAGTAAVSCSTASGV